MSKLLKTITVGAVSTAIALSASFAGAATYNFTSNLTVGSRGEAVRQLQMVLNQSADTQVASTGAGSPGNESTYFGGLTKSAVMKFQAKNGISPVSGFVGPLTRGVLNSGTVVVNPPPVNGPVSVSLAANNTPAGSIAAGSATAELAKFTFSGTGSVTNVTLQRIGLSTNNTTLNNVYLYDGATRLTDSGSVNSNGVISFNNPSGLFTVNGSRTITVRADLVAVGSGGATSGTVGVALTGYAVSGVPMTTSISGNLQVIVNVTPATVSFANAVTNPASGASVNAGTPNFTVWSNTIAISTRSVNLKAATFRYIGSAPTSALSNVKLFVDGLQVGTVATINAINGSNYAVFDLGATPYVLTTGSHTLEVRADIVGGASYSFTVSIQNQADLMLEDSQLPGTFIAASNVPTNTTGNSVSILQGSNSVTIDPAFTTTTVTGGATNVPIAQYKFTGYGEDEKITSLVVSPSLTGTTPNSTTLQNVSLYANGAQIGSTQNYTGTDLTFNLGSSLIIPSGQSVIVTVKSDIINSTSTNYTAGTIAVTLKGVTSNAEGQSSHQLGTIPSTAGISSNSLTIGGNTITVAKNAGYTNQTVSPNSPATKIGSYTIQAGSAEGLQVTNLSVGVVSWTGNSIGLNNLQNIKVVGTGISNNPVAIPTNPTNFSTNFTIPVNGSQTVDVYADVQATTGNASTTLTVTGRGLVSNVSTTTSTIAGQAITIATGGVSAAPSIVSSATLPAQYIVGPSSPTIATYNIVSTSTNATIGELRFNVTSGTVATLAISVNGSTVQTQTPVAGVVDFTGLTIPVMAGSGGVNLVVTPTYATVLTPGGISSNSTSTVSLVGIQSRSGNTTTYYGTTRSGGSGSAVVSGEQSMYLVASKPTVSINGNSVSGLGNTETELADITVSADANGDIKLNQLPISVTTSGNVSIGSQTIVVRDANNNNITTVTGTLAVSTSSSASLNIVFTGGYQIGRGTSQTFKIFATPSNVTGSSNTNSISTKLGAKGNFLWTDISGASGSIDGTFITNFPTASHAISN